MVDRSVFDGDPPDAIDVTLCQVCNRYPVVPGSVVCKYHGGTMGPFHQHTHVTGHPTEIPAPRPNPSGASPGGGRWFLAVLVAIALVAMGGLYLVDRAEQAERDARVSDLTADFATGACDP